LKTDAKNNRLLGFLGLLVGPMFATATGSAFGKVLNY